MEYARPTMVSHIWNSVLWVIINKYIRKQLYNIEKLLVISPRLREDSVAFATN